MLSEQKKRDLLVEAIDKMAAFLEKMLLEDRISPHLVQRVRKELNEAALIPRRKRHLKTTDEQ